MALVLVEDGAAGEHGGGGHIPPLAGDAFPEKNVRNNEWHPPEDKGMWSESEYTKRTGGETERTGASNSSYTSIGSNFTVSSNLQARKKRGKKRPMKFRVYCVDLKRWYEIRAYDPSKTSIEELKYKLFLGSGIRSHCELPLLP